VLERLRVRCARETGAAGWSAGRPVWRHLPKKRESRTTSFRVGGAEGYLTAGTYPDGRLGEVSIRWGKQGSTLAGLMDAMSVAISIGLQHGVPLATFVEEFTNLRFDPAGLTDDTEVRMARSVMDYIFRRLALDYLDPDEREILGILSVDEQRRQLDVGDYVAHVGLADPERVTGRE
jgi:ribonucleoside-diphosphate reductase alpha chain